MTMVRTWSVLNYPLRSKVLQRLPPLPLRIQDYALLRRYNSSTFRLRKKEWEIHVEGGGARWGSSSLGSMRSRLRKRLCAEQNRKSQKDNLRYLIIKDIFLYFRQNSVDDIVSVVLAIDY